jgi:hypothetical protein
MHDVQRVHHATYNPQFATCNMQQAAKVGRSTWHIAIRALDRRIASGVPEPAWDVARRRRQCRKVEPGLVVAAPGAQLLLKENRKNTIILTIIIICC